MIVTKLQNNNQTISKPFRSFNEGTQSDRDRPRPEQEPWALLGRSRHEVWSPRSLDLQGPDPDGREGSTDLQDCTPPRHDHWTEETLLPSGDRLVSKDA